MRSNYAFLCDHAQQEASGKINALGVGWSNLTATSVPVVHPHMTFVANVSATIAEAGSKKVEIRLIDADGGDVIPPIESDIDFVVLEPALEGNLGIVIDLNDVEFPKYGQYAFHLVVQGNEIARVPFSVVEPPGTT